MYIYISQEAKDKTRHEWECRFAFTQAYMHSQMCTDAYHICTGGDRQGTSRMGSRAPPHLYAHRRRKAHLGSQGGRSRVGRDSFICVTWRIPIWYDSFLCEWAAAHPWGKEADLESHKGHRVTHVRRQIKEERLSSDCKEVIYMHRMDTSYTYYMCVPIHVQGGEDL